MDRTTVGMWHWNPWGADKRWLSRWPAYKTATPGLVVARGAQYWAWEDTTPRASTRWTIIHLTSGLAIEPKTRMFITRKEAVAVAEALAPLADWTATANELWDIPNLTDLVRERINSTIGKGE